MPPVTQHDVLEPRRGWLCALFVAVEPKAGRRTVSVTEHRRKRDFVVFMRDLLQRVYRRARRIYLVVDNLDTHPRGVR